MNESTNGALGLEIAGPVGYLVAVMHEPIRYANGRFLANPHLDRAAPYTEAERWILSSARHREVRDEITAWPGYQPTQLHSLQPAAGADELGGIWYKDESTRFGLGSFKALGGSYGVLRVLQDEVARRTGTRGVTGKEIRAGAHSDIANDITVTCATDGNHGQAVAWGASQLGCRSVIYLPAAVSKAREAAIARWGAQIVRTEGSYDQAVVLAQRDARRLQRFVVSDTSYDAYVNIPRDVMQGYTVLVEEILEQLPDDIRPTHVFLQGGVGGLAAAVVAHLWERLGSERPIAVVVEPECASCLLASAAAGKPVTVTDVHRTVMGCLACGEISMLAWEILRPGADAFMTIGDSAVAPAMRLLAAHESKIVAGESGVGGIAGLCEAANSESIREKLGLDLTSQVLVIGTEGANDPEAYATILGGP